MNKLFLIIIVAFMISGCTTQTDLTEEAILLGCLRGSLNVLKQSKSRVEGDTQQAIDYCKSHNKLEENE